MTCIIPSETEEADHDLYWIDNNINLLRTELRKRHIRRLFEQGEVYLEDLPDDPIARCGYFFFSTDLIFGFFDKKDPMIRACSLHDSLYDPELRGDLTRKQADVIFLKAMLALAKDNIWLRKQAYLYYFIVRLSGQFFW